MKLVTFTRDNSSTNKVPQIGVLVDNESGIAILQAGAVARTGRPLSLFDNMRAFLDGGQKARDQARQTVDYILTQKPPEGIVDVDQVTLLSPVPRPASIRDCLAFEQHLINSTRVVGLKRLAVVDEWIEKIFGRRRSLAYQVNKAWYDRPIYYKSNRFSVVGTGAEVRMPSYTSQMDYELEWGIFLSKSGVDIPADRAAEYIGGYTVFNDFSARDIQMKEMGGRLGPAKGKDFDTGNAIGPCLVTPDEIPEPYNLRMTARVNGQEWSRGTTADMHWTFEEMIAYISRSEQLFPGEFIGSGTCSGSQGRGCGLEMSKFLQAGDVVELEVENIGVLKNRLVSSAGGGKA
jgi:2-keto-4-pentenoate hydratase/2-oxohepta-3-ene-1,7-dioic acid hydratase in catechol pathway